jgi:molybdenum cofactor cytidylyltransferase
MGSERFDCLVPAAGEARRMCAWKPLLPFGGTTIIGTVVATALRACARVVLVTGHRGDELEALFAAEPRVLSVRNDDWPLGMFGSIQRGVKAIGTERFFVTLGDMPWITVDAYAALAAAPHAEVVFPTFGGRRGHPVLFDITIRDAVLRADPACGSMRSLAGRLEVGELPWGDDSILRDIDTPGDLDG